MNTQELSLQTKQTKIDRYGWSLKDSPGVFLEINKHELMIDKTYQRDAARQKVLSISREWSWIACGVITVAVRDNCFFVIDGQHRVLSAMNRADITSLPCMVFETKDKKEEAKGFINANTNRKPVSAQAKHNAKVACKDRTALVVEELSISSGREISNKAGQKQIRCVALLTKLVERDEETLRKIWPTVCAVTMGHPIHERILDGLFYIETHLQGGISISDKEINKRVCDVGYERLLNGANKASAFFAKGGAKVWAMGMMEELNKKRRNKLIVDLKG